MTTFQINPRTHRVLFGGPLFETLQRELPLIGSGSYFLLTTAGVGRRFESLAPQDILTRCVGKFTDAVPHVPAEVAGRAREQVRASGAKTILAVGGGSALDTAKAVAHELPVSIIAVPTNFSGSEVTCNFGLTTGGVKRSMVDPAVLPQIVIYDPALLSSLPDDTAICSGVNAMAHAIEGMYAPNANPMTAAIAEAGVRNLVDGLAERRREGRSPGADAKCLMGAWLCGEVLAQVGMGLHHRICHVLGGTFNLSHAAAHTVVLPYSIEFNTAAAPALAALTDLFGGGTLARGLAQFARRLGAPTSLAQLGFKHSDVAEAARLALAMPLTNPRPVTPADVERLLQKALSGAPL